jgi:uncharacterized RDD family membrane protein YckC
MTEEPQYIGLVTRVIAFVLDAAVINLVALFVSVGAALILSLFHIPSDLKTVLVTIGAAVYVLWSIGYFVGFWSSETGETPGDRVMRIRVVPAEGGRLKLRRSVLRAVALVIGTIPLFAGELLILFDRRRRAFHDVVARTLVEESPTLSLAAVQRERRRQERLVRSSDSGDERAASVSQA